ncbi:MAG: hypothetical protein DBY09_00230 [Selenomonadales bacterium]|jgi:hypothetical protein|nr:MAG: hypothetical protein DBY09_00230 [Selenomonadales bacterium]
MKKARKLIGLMLSVCVCVALFSMTALADTQTDEIKNIIHDDNLEAAVIDAVGGEENLTYENIAAIESLAVTNKGIQDLEGIQLLKGLKSLDLSNNKLQVIAQLGDLKDSLENLNLSGNLIEETGPLSLLTGLKTLDVSGNLIENAGGIANLTALTALNISGNIIKDSGAFEKLAALTELNISGNQIVDAGGIANLTALKTLDISDNLIEDSGAFEKLAALTALNISGNQIADLGGLEKAGMQLETLDAADNKVEDLAPLRNMESLINLNLNGNMVKESSLAMLPVSITGSDGFAAWKEATLGTQNVSYIITVTAGENGTVAPYGNQGKVTVKSGDDQSFAITPDKDYIIDKVMADGKDVTSEVKDNTYTFAKVSGEHTLEVTFKAQVSDSQGTGDCGLPAALLILAIAGAGLAGIALRNKKLNNNK